MSSSWRRSAPRYQPRFGTWHLAPGLFRHRVMAVDPFGRSKVAVIQQELPRGFDMIDLKTIAAGATIAGALGLTALGRAWAWRTPPHLPLSHRGRRGHKISPTATDMDTTETGTAGIGAGGPGTAGPGGTRGSTRASAPPVRSATSPAACASSRGSCRRYSVAALGRWGGDASAAAARTASTRTCAVEARLAHLSDPETA